MSDRSTVWSSQLDLSISTILYPNKRTETQPAIFFEENLRLSFKSLSNKRDFFVQHSNISSEEFRKFKIL